MIKNIFSCRLATLTLLGLTSLPVSAQTNAPVNLSDRYLFIVDTSAAMRRRAPAAQKAVENLMRSSMGAQFQRGDTVGVWTFNEQLYAGRLPLQTWTPETSDLITSNVVRFLKAQNYGGESRFEAVAPTLRRIVGESPRLTILLVSDGDEPITGTGFDADIKRALDSKAREQEKARMPFITVLRAARGRIASATVNLAPWPVEFPSFPPEPKVVEAPKPGPKPKPEPPRPVVPNLVVIGNKKPEPAAATNALPAANSPTPPTATPVAPEGQPPTAVTLTNPSTTSTMSSNLPVAVPSSAKTSLPVLTNVIVPAATTATTTNTPAANLQSATPATEPTVLETPAAVAPTLPDEPATSSPANNPPSEVTVAAASESGAVPWVLIAVGTVPIVLGVSVFFFLQKRARNAGHGSLITRSLDRDKK